MTTPHADRDHSEWHDPTHGQIDRDIQEQVDAMEPTSLGQRVAIENTLQRQRDERTSPVAPAGGPGDPMREVGTSRGPVAREGDDERWTDNHLVEGALNSVLAILKLAEPADSKGGE